MMKLSQMRPINHAFCSPTVPNKGSLIIYHRERLDLALSKHSSASARLLAKADNSRAVTSLSNREKTSQNNPVAQRVGRVAKRIARCINHLKSTDVHGDEQTSAISKTAFFECFLISNSASKVDESRK